LFIVKQSVFQNCGRWAIVHNGYQVRHLIRLIAQVTARRSKQKELWRAGDSLVKVRETARQGPSCVMHGCDEIAKLRTVVDKKHSAKWSVSVCDFHFAGLQHTEVLLLAHQKGKKVRLTSK
jgi:hypothetical protein